MAMIIAFHATTILTYSEVGEAYRAAAAELREELLKKWRALAGRVTGAGEKTS
jgi:hypothetical protein